MKYIIELEKIEGMDLWKAKTKMGANTFVFSQYDIDHMLSLYDEPTEHDGCEGCKYKSLFATEEPCSYCKRNYIDKYIAKSKKTIKRWEQYEGDFEKALLDHNIYCEKDDGAWSCGVRSCRECFVKWLMEDIEVEDD